MSGDTYQRVEIAPGRYQCGCTWRRDPHAGDVLDECSIHKQATVAKVARFERERSR